MEKHTKEQWKYYSDLSAVCVIKDHTFKMVADFGKVDLPERVANANLIAAAPGLLEIAKYMEGIILSINDSDIENLQDILGEDIDWERMRNTINKAQGK